MHNQNFPFAVRLMGFGKDEVELFQDYFEVEASAGHAYACLPEDSLQDPDIYIANADDVKTLMQLSNLAPSDIRPALLVGNPLAKLPFMSVPRPIHWELLFDKLGLLIEKRADVLSRLPASELVAVPDRRRRDRLDIDLTDPAEYIKMRKKPNSGGVLVVDKNGGFASRLDDLMSRYPIAVDWVDTEEAAIDVCTHMPVAVVMINTSVPEIDPYRLCIGLKHVRTSNKVAVIFLVGKPFVYDTHKAKAAGSDGFLNKPLSPNQVLLALKKFLPLSR
jgi:CheY-like chemotaxis protein